MSSSRCWVRVSYDEGPCQRSLHVAAIWRDKMVCFGGYDGSNRVNDCWEFDLAKRCWSLVRPASGAAPSPRDRHVAVVWGSSFFVFGGFDGTSRVNDFHEFSFASSSWAPVRALSGLAPSPRHSHAAVVHEDSMYVFGGYDGSYRCDFHEFNFVTCSWAPVANEGRVPRARYRATCVAKDACMYLFGGHDGTRHLNDVHVFDFRTRSWSAFATDGPSPIPRDSHVAVCHGQSMYVFGGSTGSAMNDFHELRLDTRKWSPVQTTSGYAPGHRFCHVAVVYKDSLFVFGGYDGQSRLNDFLEFKFGFGGADIPASSLVSDLRALVDTPTLSDVAFKLEDGKYTVRAHRVLCTRCPYFKALLTGEMVEARAKEIAIDDVKHSIFLALLEYLYTDSVDIPLDVAMDLFQAADRFGIDRLKRMCEGKMLASISVDNAAAIFHAADQYTANSLRDKCLNFILANFDAVTRTPAFEEMGRTNVDLVFEILRARTAAPGHPPQRPPPIDFTHHVSATHPPLAGGNAAAASAPASATPGVGTLPSPPS
ncbi:hypothetical protein CTAYLR_008520 [Chrysophaeum taylorii]|uniref:BTB domain-containing protein n=1 Tax=Chrysophaeum taylorii TaxID=2483200 RepID=A0AAD7UKF7_9STRA|nr:hypothetical protein CTAYLR_008520 [Chrysophaeum taylorii]